MAQPIGVPVRGVQGCHQPERVLNLLFCMGKPIKSTLVAITTTSRLREAGFLILHSNQPASSIHTSGSKSFLGILDTVRNRRWDRILFYTHNIQKVSRTSFQSNRIQIKQSTMLATSSATRVFLRKAVGQGARTATRAFTSQSALFTPRALNQQVSHSSSQSRSKKIWLISIGIQFFLLLFACHWIVPNM